MNQNQILDMLNHTDDAQNLALYLQTKGVFEIDRVFFTSVTWQGEHNPYGSDITVGTAELPNNVREFLCYSGECAIVGAPQNIYEEICYKLIHEMVHKLVIFLNNLDNNSDNELYKHFPKLRTIALALNRTGIGLTPMSTMQSSLTKGGKAVEDVVELIAMRIYSPTFFENYINALRNSSINNRNIFRPKDKEDINIIMIIKNSVDRLVNALARDSQ